MVYRDSTFLYVMNEAAGRESGGEEGIRTPGTREGSTVFKTAAIDRSATSPLLLFYRLIFVFPPMNGWSATGISTEPSFCW